MSKRNHSYQFYKDSAGSIIAVSTYAGHTVRGVAKCHPNDTFDEEFGKRLAAARCDLKIRERRAKNASNQYNEAILKLSDAEDRAAILEDRCDNAWQDFYDAEDELYYILAEVQNG